MTQLPERCRRADVNRGRCASMVSRRAFLGKAAVSLGGLLCSKLGLPGTVEAEAGNNTRVILVGDPAVMPRRNIDSKVAEEMVHRAVCLLTGKEDRTLAWKSLFSPKEKVAIKVNTRYPPVVTNPEVVQAIVDGLNMAGVDENCILIYDLTDEELEKAGYTLNDSPKGVRCHTSREYTDMKAGFIPVKVSKILTDYADAIVNVPAFRHHIRAGVTFSLKNHLGSVENPRDFHRDNCTYVADISALDPIRKKTRLIIVDAIRGQCNGGPSYQPWFAWKYAGLIAGTDSVAVDTIAAEEMKAERHKRGIRGPIDPQVKHIPRAKDIGLGIGNLERINVIRWPT